METAAVRYNMLVALAIARPAQSIVDHKPCDESLTCALRYPFAQCSAGIFRVMCNEQKL